MAEEPNRKPSSGLRNPLLYTSTLLLIALVYVVGTFLRGLACLGIDIPIGLLGSPRACDIAARKLLGRPRGS